jgi:hypothetical protein
MNGLLFGARLLRPAARAGRTMSPRHIAEIAIRAGVRGKAAERAKGGPADQNATAATSCGE